MNKSILTLLVISLAGCAYQSAGVYERPDGKAFRTPRQPRMASASHWKYVADNEAKQLVQRLNGKPVLVEKSNVSNFSDTYHNLLTSSLVSNGAAVVTADKYDNVKVTYNVNVVNHERGGQAPDLANHGKGLGLPVLTYYLLSEVVGLVKIPPAVFAEQLAKNLSTTTEVVITTQASLNDELLYSASNVYYVDGRNQWEYVETPQSIIPMATPNHTAGDAVYMKVVGDQR